MDSYVWLPLPAVSPGYTRDATSVSTAAFTGGSISRLADLQPLEPIYYNGKYCSMNQSLSSIHLLIQSTVHLSL